MVSASGSTCGVRRRIDSDGGHDLCAAGCGAVAAIAGMRHRSGDGRRFCAYVWAPAGRPGAGTADDRNTLSGGDAAGCARRGGGCCGKCRRQGGQEGEREPDFHQSVKEK